MMSACCTAPKLVAVSVVRTRAYPHLDQIGHEALTGTDELSARRCLLATAALALLDAHIDIGLLTETALS